MTTIGKIRIKGVRGIRAELPIDLDGRSLLLRGDNGTGKSSIAQALRWAVTGAPTGPGAKALPDAFQRHSLDADPAACEVTVDLLPKGRIVMKAGKVDVVETDEAGRAYIDACVRSNPFLRRDELLGFLGAAPVDRFKYLEQFLDLDRAERLGAELGAVAKKHEGLAKDADAALSRLVELAATHLPPDGSTLKSSSDLLARLCGRAGALGITVDAGLGFDGLVALRANLGVKPRSDATTSRRLELANAVRDAKSLVPPDHPRTVLERLRDAEQRASETELVRLLTEAIVVVENRPSLESCPVCEQHVEVDALAARLRARVAVLAEVRALTQDASALAGAWSKFLSTLDAVEHVASAGAGKRSVYASGRALLDELERSDGGTLSARVLARVDGARRSLETQLAAIPDDLRASELAKLADAIDAAIGARVALERHEANHAKHALLGRKTRAVEKSVGAARKDVAEEILESIASLVASYYERIHPPDQADEVTGAPTIKVTRHGGGTAHVRGLFNKQEIDDPRFVYSDGHLDTVGICIFLALRKSSNAGPKLLVLDDVVLSIDLGHADRLVKVLRDDFKDHQVLLFSHNELFMRMCRALLSGAKDLAIVRWTLQCGPQIRGRIMHVDRLRKTLEESGSAQEVALHMLPVLDELLSACATAFELRLPTTRTRGLTVDEYWSQLKPKLAELTKVRVLPDLAAVFEKIGTPSFFRNALGAHLNDWALEASLRQVQQVAEGVLELVEHLHCTRCKSVVTLTNSREPAQGFECECAHPSRPSLRSATPSTTDSAA